jgi:hypothetical protein
MEFDYANEESLYCRPLSLAGGDGAGRMKVPAEAGKVAVAYLPPMSGLTASELRLDPGAISVRIGEGRTAEVLRNLCLGLSAEVERPGAWGVIVEEMRRLFGVTLEKPKYVPERGEIEMSYRERSGTTLDISSAGRGLHQTLLLISYLQANPGSVLLLDEPDAHLEILRQREIYELLTSTARQHGSQIIAASHSEVILNEAGDRDVVVAFVGMPHRVDDRGVQVRKALKEIGFDALYQAEVKGWALYVEGATDLAILKSFAKTLDHPAREHLETVFAHHVGNQPQKARDHFFGVREAKSDLVGLALFDRLEGETLRSGTPLKEVMWKRREIENYLFLPDVLRRYARQAARQRAAGPLFEDEDAARSVSAMEEALTGLIPPIAMSDAADSWWRDERASDVLDRIFEYYFKKLKLPNLMRKTDYHILAGMLEQDEIDPEVRQVLDAIVEIAGTAQPRQ